jgi:hypothetical protein
MPPTALPIAAQVPADDLSVGASGGDSGGGDRGGGGLHAWLAIACAVAALYAASIGKPGCRAPYGTAEGETCSVE